MLRLRLRLRWGGGKERCGDHAVTLIQHLHVLIHIHSDIGGGSSFLDCRLCFSSSSRSFRLFLCLQALILFILPSDRGFRNFLIVGIVRIQDRICTCFGKHLLDTLDHNLLAGELVGGGSMTVIEDGIAFICDTVIGLGVANSKA